VTSDKHFLEALWDYYDHDARNDLAWRLPESDGTYDPYKILVSEYMLQQTQVRRVVPKFGSFIGLFPTLRSLADASLADVLRAWSGLGYNRRAQYLEATAKYISILGHFPTTESELLVCKGIGVNTARAILCYTFNQPHVFVETNIRTVYIHHYFADSTSVPDSALLPIIERTIDESRPREFYWALMDYGTYLKQNIGNVSRSSITYKKQSTFNGSKRKVRGEVIALLTAGDASIGQLKKRITDERLQTVLEELLREGLIMYKDKRFCLPE
jgi:A/G-specific adenine glycosylase